MQLRLGLSKAASKCCKHAAAVKAALSSHTNPQNCIRRHMNTHAVLQAGHLHASARKPSHHMATTLLCRQGCPGGRGCMAGRASGHTPHIAGSSKSGFADCTSSRCGPGCLPSYLFAAQCLRYSAQELLNVALFFGSKSGANQLSTIVASRSGSSAGHCRDLCCLMSRCVLVAFIPCPECADSIIWVSTREHLLASSALSFSDMSRNSCGRSPRSAFDVLGVVGSALRECSMSSYSLI